MLRFPRVLRHRDFRWLWLAQAVSTVGDRMVVVALALFVFDLTGSATDLGLVLAAQSLPFVALLLVGGVWADRLPRHRVIVATDLVRFALHALVAGLILAHAITVWHLVVIEAVFGSAEAFFRPAYTGLVPQTVPEDEVQEANALSAASFNAAELLGPALATALVVGVGAGYAFALDAATFLLSAGLMLLVRPRPRGAPERRQTMLRELAEGYHQVRSRAWVWVTIAVFSLSLMLGLAPYFVLGPAIAGEEYGSTAVYGILTAFFGGGTVIGALVGIRWRPERPMRAAFVACAGWPACIGLFALGADLWLVLPATVAGGFGIALFDVWWGTALAQRIPPHALSRVSAYDWMGSLGLLPLGYLLAGPAAAALGAGTVMLAGAAITFALLCVGLVPRETRQLRRLEADAAAGAVANGGTSRP